MGHKTKLKIQELEKRRSILCDECESLEQELRQYEDEIEWIDNKISNLKQLYQRQSANKEAATKIFTSYNYWLKS